MTACAALPLDADASLVGALTSLDCQVNAAVSTGYARLFGVGGGLGYALSIALTLYLVVVALGLLTGHTRLTLRALGPKVLTLAFVLTFATAWPSYQAVVYGLLTGGPDQIASAFIGARSGATLAFAARLDSLFDAVVDIGRSLSAMPKAPNLGLASNLVWGSALILLLSTLGLLVIARIALGVLLALGPVFIVFSLFEATRGLFDGWLRTAVAFAVAPTLVVLGGSGLLAVIGPLIAAVADDPVGAVAAVRPVIALFLACVIYAGLALMLVVAAAGVTRGWRTRGRSAAAADAPAAAALFATHSQSPAAQASATASSADDRVGHIAATLLRDSARPAAVRTAALVESPPPHGGGQRETQRRSEPLGQSFRPSAPRRPLTGTLGS